MRFFDTGSVGTEATSDAREDASFAGSHACGDPWDTGLLAFTCLRSCSLDSWDIAAGESGWMEVGDEAGTVDG